MDECIRKGVTSNEEYLPGRLKVKRRAKNLYKRSERRGSLSLCKGIPSDSMFLYGSSLTKGFYAPGEPSLTMSSHSQLGGGGNPGGPLSLGPEAQPVVAQGVGERGAGGEALSPLAAFDGQQRQPQVLRGQFDHPIPPISPVRFNTDFFFFLSLLLLDRVDR
jgi:hypothetical protein